jgi:hypothetical protein
MVALIEKAGKKCWMSERAGRTITNAEVTDAVERSEMSWMFSKKSRH